MVCNYREKYFSDENQQIFKVAIISVHIWQFSVACINFRWSNLALTVQCFDSFMRWDKAALAQEGHTEATGAFASTFALSRFHAIALLRFC